MSSGNLVSSSRSGPGGCSRVPAPPRFFQGGVRSTCIPALNRTVGGERGPGSSWRRIAALLSLVCVSCSALSDQDVGYGAYSYPRQSYTEDPVYASPYESQGGGSTGMGAGDISYPPSGVSGRSSTPYGNDPYLSRGSQYRYEQNQGGDGDDPYLSRGSQSRDEQTRGGGSRPYPGVSEEAPYGWNESPRFDGPRDGANAYDGGWGSGGGLPPAVARGYRFRGDGPAGEDAWRASRRRDGYRFRPLTEQELEQRDSVSGWRPRELERSGERPARRDPPPVEEAYGYESDNWFRRYYRQRP